MASLTIEGISVRVEVSGDPARPAIMLSHALGSDLTMWDRQIAALTPHFRVIRYNTRGHGGSDLGQTPFSIGDLGRDALAILDALEIERTHWLGLSMGGAIGLWLLAHAPERIDKAVIANSGPRLGVPETWNARILTALTEGTAPLADATMERWFSADFATRDPDGVARIADVFRRTTGTAYAACSAALRDVDLRGSMPVIPHDVLVIAGRDDTTVSLADATQCAAALPNGRLHVLATQHLSNIESQAEFDAAVVAFLTAKPAPLRRLRGTAKSGATSVKPAVPKRARATLHSNPARSPLKKTATKRAAPKKARAAQAGKAAVRRRAAAKASDPRRAATKVARKRPTKKSRKAALPRRQTSLSPARVAAAKPPVKAPLKKGKTSKKAGVKKVLKNPTKRAPIARRKPAGPPRRPKGRRKP